MGNKAWCGKINSGLLQAAKAHTSLHICTGWPMSLQFVELIQEDLHIQLNLT